MTYLLITLACIAAIWVLSGTLAYGFTFAYFQGRYPMLAKKEEATDRATALSMAVWGPFGLVVAVERGGWRYGLKYKSGR